LESIHKYGGCRGTWRGVLRVLRCRPGCPGGHDPA
ncbi:MAG: membrane protein insertion efficiency factor YidD, partial [Planctomycetota bacterium]|nr:membrane protein insertion efficiency factor YidD [Planctomycetota bacterium]